LNIRHAPYQQAPKILKQFFPACLSADVSAEPSKSVLVWLELNVLTRVVDSWTVFSSVSTNKGNAKAVTKTARIGPSIMNIIQHDSTILQRQSKKNWRTCQGPSWKGSLSAEFCDALYRQPACIDARSPHP
jgi:hypothetical protein